MNVFIAGLTGATGQLLAIQLLQQGHDVWGYARNLESLPAFMKTHPNLHAKQGSLLNWRTTYCEWTFQAWTQSSAV